jgi:hypothetical protein
MMAILSMLLFFQQLFLEALIPSSYVVITLGCLLHLKLTKNYELLQWSQLVLMLFFPAALMWLMGGFRSGGGLVIWSVLPAIAMLLINKPNRALKLFIGFLVLLLFSAYFDTRFAAMEGEGGLDTQANAGEEADRAQIEAILHQLTSAIEAFDPSAQDIAEQLVGLMGPSHSQATELLRLTEQYEFDAALTMVHQLLAQNASG